MSAYTDLCKNVADYFEESFRKWQEACDRGDPVARYPNWVATYENNLKAARYWRKKAEELEYAVTSF